VPDPGAFQPLTLLLISRIFVTYSIRAHDSIEAQLGCRPDLGTGTDSTVLCRGRPECALLGLSKMRLP